LLIHATTSSHAMTWKSEYTAFQVFVYS
jgi:hypothetical protein